MNNQEHKYTFTNCVGENVYDVAEDLKKQYPDLLFEPVQKGEFVTMEFRLDRVRMYYDENNKIVRALKRG